MGIFKKIVMLSFAPFLFLILSIDVYAGDLISTDEWDYRINNNVGTIVSYRGSASEIIIPSEIDGVIIKNIGDYSFAGNINIESVEISEGITSIEEGAFTGCYNLKKVKIPSTLESIKYKEYFGYSCFDECFQLENIIVTDDNKKFSSIDGVLFNKEKTALLKYPTGKKESIYYIPNTVEYIMRWAFNHVTIIEDIHLSQNMYTFDPTLFIDCNNLKNIYVDDSNDIFYDVDGVLYNKANSSIVLYPYAREEKTYEIIENMCTIGPYAFFKCYNLENIKIPETVTYIEENAFCNCTNLNEIDLPDSLLKIENKAFASCKNLLNINIPNTVTYIGEEAFGNCINLENVILSKNITQITDGMFINCFALKEIIIPQNVDSIEYNAFAGCKELKCIKFDGKKPNNIANSAFNNCNNNLKLLYNINYEESWLGYSDYSIQSYGEKITETTTIIESNNNAVTNLKKVKIKYVKNKKKRSIVIKMNKLDNAKKYTIQYSTNKKFKNRKSKTSKNVKVILKNLKLGKIYYIRIRGINNNIKGKWSKTVKIKIRK